VRPRFPAGARPEDEPDPERIDIDVDLSGWGEGLVAATASGALTISPDGGPVRGALQVRATPLRLDERLRAGAAPELARVWERLSPAGVSRRVDAVVEGPERLHLAGEGADLTIRPAEFPYPLRVDGFDLSRDGRAIRLHEVRAASTAGEGRLVAKGTILR